jgi:hypothetical protein
MFKSLRFTTLALFVILSSSALAAELPQRALGHDLVLHGGNSLTSRASRDSVFLLGPWGSGAQANGQFETTSGIPAWNNWTSVDHTQPTSNHWHISDYNAENLNSTPNNLAMYCGDETFPACSGADVVGGYGNNWNDILQFNYTVANAGEPCDVSISGFFNYNTEQDYDYITFRFVTDVGQVVMANINGEGTATYFNHQLSYASSDYVGENHDQVRFEIAVISDGGYSDEDCGFSSNGACQLDDLRVQVSNGNYDNTSDFQDGMGPDWELATVHGFGDFAEIWVGLSDWDPCLTNNSPQVAFIDDGTQYPGVGPSYCQNWCYGPGGYIVNVTGGASDGAHELTTIIHNSIVSPVLDWPGSQYTSALLTFGVFRHEDLSDDSPGIFYFWSVRSAVDPLDLNQANWLDRNFVYYGPPAYIRAEEEMSDLIVPGATVAQVQLTCWDDNVSWDGDDGYPAPYFDNVRLVASGCTGPVLSAREMDLAQDNFPEAGHLDLSNLAGMNVRFDAACNQGDDVANVPGDSIVCNVTSVRVGGQVVENRLYYTMERNPVFDSVRDENWGVSGFVDGVPSLNSAGIPVQNKFAYDLPDSGFLFPGDLLHYYISATDDVAGSDPMTATIPADLAGFGDFPNPRAYNSSFQVNCLPSVRQNGEQPKLLFWNDFGNRGGEASWFYVLNVLNLERGDYYDLYYTNAPSAGVGNGLGGRATAALLSGYDILLYTSGDLGVNTISNGDANCDPSCDVQLLTEWFSQDEVRALFTGDNLVSDLDSSGPLTSTFLADYLNVVSESNTLRPFINNQATPKIQCEQGNEVFYLSDGWIANGGCPDINAFDAVLAGPGASRLARFCNPSGVPDYVYSAATLNQRDDDRIISIPYDFMYLYTDISNPPPGGGFSARTYMMLEVLEYFQFVGPPFPPTDVPEMAVFSVQNYPNPFNPSTRIEFNLPRPGHLGLKIFNLRGELVKTLIDEERPAGSDHITWDGLDDNGSGVSSGVYFYEARTAGEVVLGKMALVR